MHTARQNQGCLLESVQNPRYVVSAQHSFLLVRKFVRLRTVLLKHRNIPWYSWGFHKSLQKLGALLNTRLGKNPALTVLSFVQSWQSTFQPEYVLKWTAVSSPLMLRFLRSSAKDKQEEKLCHFLLQVSDMKNFSDTIRSSFTGKRLQKHSAPLRVWS